MKKVVCYITMFAVIISFFGVYIQNVEAHSDNMGRIIWHQDFDGGDISGGFDRTEGTISTQVLDAEHGNSAKIEIDNSGWPAFYKEFDNEISSGTLYIGYDLYRTDVVGRSFDTFLKTMYSEWGDGLYLGSYILGNGEISYLENCHIDSWGKDFPGDSMVKKEKWMRIDTWLDLDNRTATYYMDGELIGVTPITPELTSLSAYSRKINPGNGTAIEYYDNIDIIHYSGANKNITCSSAKGKPEYFDCVATGEIVSDELGYNYFDEDAKVSLRLKSVITEEVKSNILMTVVDESGKMIYKESREITLLPKSEIIEDFTVKLEKYGFYRVNASFKSNGYDTGFAETKIVRIKEAPEQNAEMGYSAHSYWGYGSDELDRKQKILARAGFKYHREEVFWTNFEAEKGVYGFDEKQKFLNDTSFENNIDRYVILAGYGGRTDLSDGEVPASDWARVNFGNYVYNVVSEFKGRAKYYEVFNEQIRDADIYTAAQKVAYESAKKADPDCIVICGATARVPLEWIEELLKLGCGEYFDAFSCHPYTIEGLPEKGLQATGQVSFYVDGVKQGDSTNLYYSIDNLGYPTFVRIINENPTDYANEWLGIDNIKVSQGVIPAEVYTQTALDTFDEGSSIYSVGTSNSQSVIEYPEISGRGKVMSVKYIGLTEVDTDDSRPEVSLKLVNSSGAETASFTNGERAYLQLSVSNQGTIQPIQVSLVSYDSRGVMKNSVINNYVIEAGGTKIIDVTDNYSISTEGVSLIKAFVWSDWITIKPLCDSAEASVQ